MMPSSPRTIRNAPPRRAGLLVTREVVQDHDAHRLDPYWNGRVVGKESRRVVIAGCRSWLDLAQPEKESRDFVGEIGEVLRTHRGRNPADVLLADRTLKCWNCRTRELRLIDRRGCAALVPYDLAGRAMPGHAFSESPHRASESAHLRRKVRIVPSRVTSAGMMLWRCPPWMFRSDHGCLVPGECARSDGLQSSTIARGDDRITESSAWPRAPAADVLPPMGPLRHAGLPSGDVTDAISEKEWRPKMTAPLSAERLRDHHDAPTSSPEGRLF